MAHMHKGSCAAIKNVEGLARILKVLGEPNRLDRGLAIRTNPRSVTEIVKVTNLSRSLVSFHLKALRNNGILKTERDGPFVFYALANTSLIDHLDDFSQAAHWDREKTGPWSLRVLYATATLILWLVTSTLLYR